jgi:hypothetical protein
MQVAAKAPQMPGETIESKASGPSDFVRAQLRVVPSTTSTETHGEKSEEETRAGLRRLAELIKDKRRSTTTLMPVKNQTAEISPLSVEKMAVEEPKIERIDVEGSYHLIPFILKWQDRRRRKKTAADLVREEAHRKRALQIYKKAAKRKPASIALSY